MFEKTFSLGSTKLFFLINGFSLDFEATELVEALKRGTKNVGFFEARKI